MRSADPSNKYWYHGTLPEPRQQLGGSGLPWNEISAYFPEHQYGLTPMVRVDLSSPPIFENVAVYLGRHGLFLPGEQVRIALEDFEPETLDR